MTATEHAQQRERVRLSITAPRRPDTYRDRQTQQVNIVLADLAAWLRFYPHAPSSGEGAGTGDSLGRRTISWYFENTTSERALELALQGCAARCIDFLALEVKPA
jgi:hypothetical protein